ERGLAGAVIVTGRATGQPAALEDLRQTRRGAPDAPLYVGSGATVERLAELLAIADGVIVGTAAKVDGRIGNPVDAARVRALADAAAAARGG
ncbi:MAG TPA: BtpA/SgcQ family protein, partial [Thermomicrobiales bacterium]|nr:BtpA/SgcQ family protein [Thermomicrobiales bacterium]